MFHKNAGGVVLLSYGLWQHHFGSDTKSSQNNHSPWRARLVCGCDAVGFSFPEAVQAWAPLHRRSGVPTEPRVIYSTLRESNGRLDGAVRADLQAISAK
jgi:hypothetical protein